MKAGFSRTLVGGIAGGTTFYVATFLTFVLIGSGLDQQSGPLLDPTLQSTKVIAVLTEMEPLPLFGTAPQLIFLAYVLFGIGYAFLFRSVADAWPEGAVGRTWRLAVVIWTFSCLFFELLGPFNLLGEPLGLVALELVFWAVAALVESVVIVAVLRQHDLVEPVVHAS